MMAPHLHPTPEVVPDRHSWPGLVKRNGWKVTFLGKQPLTFECHNTRLARHLERCAFVIAATHGAHEGPRRLFHLALKRMAWELWMTDKHRRGRCA
jgi:hypothetical protein